MVARRRRLRLNRVRSSAATAQSDMEMETPICRLQISSSIFNAPNGQSRATEVADQPRPASFMAKKFPEELHMPLLFNDENYRCEEERIVQQIDDQTMHTGSAASRGPAELFGIFVNPLAFVRS